MMMWQVSPVALGPTIRSTDLTVALNGFLLLKVLRGRSPFSSSAGTFTLSTVFVAACATVRSGLLATVCCRLALHWTPVPRKDCAPQSVSAAGVHSNIVPPG